MVTPADVMFWTKLTVSSADCNRLSAAAEARLIADGGGAITGELRTQLICYLIADYITAKTTDSTAQSESIGGYSYTAKSETTTTVWYTKYWEILKSATSAMTAAQYSGSSMAQRNDTDLFHMNWSYGGRMF